MKKTTRSYLRKIVGKGDNLSACRSAERTTERKDVAHNSLTKRLATQQEGASSLTPCPLERGKKRRIPFVALALVAVFAGLSIVSLVRQPLSASATSSNSSSATLRNSASVPLANPTAEGPNLPIITLKEKGKVLVERTEIDLGACENIYNPNEAKFPAYWQYRQAGGLDGWVVEYPPTKIPPTNTDPDNNPDTPPPTDNPMKSPSPHDTHIVMFYDMPTSSYEEDTNKAIEEEKKIPKCIKVVDKGLERLTCEKGMTLKMEVDEKDTGSYEDAKRGSYEWFDIYSECVQGTGWVFPCSDIDGVLGTGGTINPSEVRKDWLSGDGDKGGRLVKTQEEDTLEQKGVEKLLPYTMGIGFLLMAPMFVLIGYQVLWASVTFRHAGALEAIPRLLLGVLALAGSYHLTSMLIGLANELNSGVVALHGMLGYPQAKIGDGEYAYTLTGDGDSTSYRGIVIPVTRWGCIMNVFMGILGEKLLTDLLQYLPFVGGPLHLVGKIGNIILVVKHLGEFILLILSISLCTQVFVRILFLNYYILMAPIAFACWGIPGGVGTNVVRQWCKGFFSVLFVQGVQLFVLTTFPLVIPVFPPLPKDTFGMLNIFFQQLPRIIVMLAVLNAPKVLTGKNPLDSMAQAGTVAGGAVTAAAGVAYSTV